MKIRNSFVSNSSSCSYVLSGVMIDVESVVKFMRENFSPRFDIEHFGYRGLWDEVDYGSKEEIRDNFDDYGIELNMEDVDDVSKIYKQIDKLKIDIMTGNDENGVERGKILIGFYKGTGDGWVTESTVIDGDSDGAKATRELFQHLCGGVPEDLRPVTYVSSEMC